MFEDDDEGPALPSGHMIDAEEIESTTSQPIGSMRSRALSTQAKLDALQKEREAAQKSKMAKRAAAGMLVKNDGPAAAERKGLRMVAGSDDDDSEEDMESRPEPTAKKNSNPQLSTDRGASVTALGANRRTGGSTTAEKRLQMMGLSTEVDHSEREVDSPQAPDSPPQRLESTYDAGALIAAAHDDDDNDDDRGDGPAPPIDLSDIRQFVLMCMPRSQSQPVQCYIKRCRSGLQKLWPYYVLYSQDPDKFLLAGRRRKKNKQSTYLISTDEKDLSRKSNAYTGKVKSNYFGTEFTIYDSGANPSDNKGNEEVRQELGVVQYDRNVLGTNGPRKMQVYLPKTARSGVREVLQPTQPQDKMSAKLENDDHNFIKIVNKTPRWNENLGAFCLNFQGRVTVASVKNFQLVDEAEQDRIVLQFGKCSDDTFTMDYCYPMCALQAFAICLSSFDHKLACE
mmetsp:Transcript_29209/g.72128  ORF Transcript_29209/g.72128 Transcript_29209/m.72128 type:complete len:454 (+) Transcript_29209:47-1408(+)